MLFFFQEWMGVKPLPGPDLDPPPAPSSKWRSKVHSAHWHSGTGHCLSHRNASTRRSTTIGVGTGACLDAECAPLSEFRPVQRDCLCIDLEANGCWHHIMLQPMLGSHSAQGMMCLSLHGVDKARACPPLHLPTATCTAIHLADCSWGESRRPLGVETRQVEP